MSLRARIKKVWEDKVVGCFAPNNQDESSSPSTSAAEPTSTSPAVPTATYQRSRGSQIPPSNLSLKAVSSPDEGSVNGADDVEKVGNAWVVPDVGKFLHKAVYTFSGDTLPEGLYASEYIVQNRMGDEGPQSGVLFNHRFDPANVQLSDGYLNLTVPGGQRPSRTIDKAISCAEIVTTESNIASASVRTRAIFSKVPGTCHGMFFYKSDTQEMDIEYLTDPTSLSNNGPSEPIPIWYTNQPTDPSNPGEHDPTSQTGAAPFDCTTQVHEYRIDWTPEFTVFYVDGFEQKRYFDNIPSKPGPWIWNNWANGDKGWSKGPPEDAADNIFKIQSIIMYFNTSSDVGPRETPSGA